MAVLSQAQISDLALDRIQANVTTDPPFSATEIQRRTNEAYKLVWEISGGRIKYALHGSAWNTSGTVSTGAIYGLLTDVGEVLRVFATTTPTVGVTTTTDGSSLLTSAALFLTNSIEAGMQVSKSDIPFASGIYVASVGDASNLILSAAASGSSASLATFYRIRSSIELEPAELAEIEYLRNQSGLGTYAVPKLYAVSRFSTPTGADVNKLRIDIWPTVAGYGYPIHYRPQFTPLDGTTYTTPEVNDLESYDIGLIAAAIMAPLSGRAELVPSILGDVSETTAKALERKFKSMLEAA